MMISFPTRVALGRLAIAAVKWNLLARRRLSAVMVAVAVAIDVMAVEMTGNAVAAAM